MPTRRPGHPPASARRAIENVEVFVASSASGSQDRRLGRLGFHHRLDDRDRPGRGVRDRVGDNQRRMRAFGARSIGDADGGMGHPARRLDINVKYRHAETVS
jgi:hypothetical protein